MQFLYFIPNQPIAQSDQQQHTYASSIMNFANEIANKVQLMNASPFITPN